MGDYSFTQDEKLLLDDIEVIRSILNLKPLKRKYENNSVALIKPRALKLFECLLLESDHPDITILSRLTEYERKDYTEKKKNLGYPAEKGYFVAPELERMDDYGKIMEEQDTDAFIKTNMTRPREDLAETKIGTISLIEKGDVPKHELLPFRLSQDSRIIKAIMLAYAVENRLEEFWEKSYSTRTKKVIKSFIDEYYREGWKITPASELLKPYLKKETMDKTVMNIDTRLISGFSQYFYMYFTNKVFFKVMRDERMLLIDTITSRLISKEEHSRLVTKHPDAWNRLIECILYEHMTHISINDYHMYLVNKCWKQSRHPSNNINYKRRNIGSASTLIRTGKGKALFDIYTAQLKQFDQEEAKQWLELTTIFNKIFNKEYHSVLMEEGKKK